MVTIFSNFSFTSGKKLGNEIKKATKISQPTVVAFAVLRGMLGTLECGIAFCICMFAH